MKTEWENVSNECKWGNDPLCNGALRLGLKHNETLIFYASEYVPNLGGNYRAIKESDGLGFRVEHLTKAKPPEEVIIQTEDSTGSVLGTKRISYKSAVELGLIEEDRA